jgi:hypothetical protein
MELDLMMERYTTRDKSDGDDDRSQECELGSKGKKEDVQDGVKKVKKQKKITDMFTVPEKQRPSPDLPVELGLAQPNLDKDPPWRAPFTSKITNKLTDEHASERFLTKGKTSSGLRLSKTFGDNHNMPDVRIIKGCLKGIMGIPEIMVIDCASGMGWDLESIYLGSEITPKFRIYECAETLSTQDLKSIFIAGMTDKIQSLQDRDTTKEQEDQPTFIKDTMKQPSVSKNKQNLMKFIPGASSQAEEPGKLPVEMPGLQTKHREEVQEDMLALEGETTNQVVRMAKEKGNVVGEAKSPANMNKLAKKTMISKHSVAITPGGTMGLVMKYEMLDSVKDMPNMMEGRQNTQRKILKGGRGKSKAGRLVQAKMEMFMTISQVTQVEQGRPPKRKQVDMGDKQSSGMKYARKK